MRQEVPGSVNLLDYLVIAVPCPECKSPVHTTFSRALAVQELECINCQGVRFGFSIGGRAMPQVEEAFQRIQAQIRQAGGWVEVRPYP